MTLLWFGGFEGLDSGDVLGSGDHADDGYGLPLVANNIGGTINYASDYLISGELGLQGGFANGQYATYEIGDDAATLIFGAAIKRSVNPAENTTYPDWSFYDSSGNLHCHILYDVNAGVSTINLRDSANGLLATSKNFYISWPANPFYIEIKLTIHATAGACEIRINGAEVMNETNLDTYGSGTAGIGRFRMMVGGGSGTLGIDDMYILNTSGDAPHNDFLGPCVVEATYPNADGDYTDWTASAGDRWAALDEHTIGGQDGDATYVYSSTEGHQITSHLTDVAITDTIFAIAHNFVARQDSYSWVEITELLRINGSDYDGDDFVMPTGYRNFRQIFTENPDDSAAWEDADIDGLQIGFTIKSLVASTAPPTTV